MGADVSLFGYLLLGAFMYLSGFAVNQKILQKHFSCVKKQSIKHPIIIKYILICFVVMFLASMLIGRFVLHHDGFDWAFICVNALVATVVFYFGLNPDTTKMNMPD